MWGETCDPKSLGGEQLPPDPKALSLPDDGWEMGPAPPVSWGGSAPLFFSTLEHSPKQLRGQVLQLCGVRAGQLLGRLLRVGSPPCPK